MENQATTDMTGTTTVSGAITFRSQYRATRAIVARNKATWFGYGFFVGVPLVLLPLMIAQGYNVSTPVVPGLSTWLAFMLGPVFMLGLLPLTQAFQVWSMRRRNASIREVLTFVISPEGFECHGRTFDTKIRWDAFHKVVETREFFLFYIAANWAHCIPKEIIPSAAGVEGIRGTIAAAMGDKAKLISVEAGPIKE